MNGAVVLRPIRFQCVVVLILTVLPWSFDFIWTPLHAHVKLVICILSSVLCRMRIAPDLPVRNKLWRKLVNLYQMVNFYFKRFLIFFCKDCAT
jgi:hypothetical protein